MDSCLLACVYCSWPASSTTTTIPKRVQYIANNVLSGGRAGENRDLFLLSYIIIIIIICLL